MQKTTMRVSLLAMLAICSLAPVSTHAGSLEPPPGPVSPTHPADTCFDNSGNRFVDCGNGTITDTETGLFWLKDASCLGTMTWASANVAAAGLGHGQCGLTDGSLPGDWRLPTVGCPAGFSCAMTESPTGEFASIFAPSCPPPFVLDTAGDGCWSEGVPFSGVQLSGYWSSTTNVDSPSDAWFAYLDYGFVNTLVKTADEWAWPVRGRP